MARRWCPDAIEIMLGYVWQGFDRMHEEHFDVNSNDENIEDDITALAWLRISDLMDGMAPYRLMHKPPENEQRKGPSPTPDLGFVWRANPRAVFPLEAKVLRTDGGVSAYIREITENFLTGRYASFSSEAAMLGYLLRGLPENVFRSISDTLGCQLSSHSSFLDRNHRCSDHLRGAEERGNEHFRCHHMVVDFGRSGQPVN
jgi:hypothetical protein